MPQESIWMTPESFVEKYIDNPMLLKAVIRIRYDGDDERGNDIAIRVMEQRPVSLEEIKSVRVTWSSSRVRSVAQLSDYVSAAKSNKDGFVHIDYPFVDKKHGLIIDTDGAHEALAGFLFTAYAGYDAAPFGERGARYILSGYGYYLSSIGNGRFWVGKVLFDHDSLDSDDAEILGKRIRVIENVSDFQNNKR